MPVDEILICEKVITSLVAKWSRTDEEQLRNLNFGTIEESNIIHIGTTIPSNMITEAEELFHTLKNVFAWSYHDLRSIPDYFAQHKTQYSLSWEISMILKG